jgi:hypothetical protein
MEKVEVKSSDHFLQLFKQRVDIELDFQNKKVIGKTKMSFHVKNLEELNESVLLNVNSENMFINKVFIYNNISSEPMTAASEVTTSNQNLKFFYQSPEKTIFYLDEIYLNIEDIDSFKNLNRVELENRTFSSLEIEITKAHLLQAYNLNKPFKIVIEYELDEKYIGIVFQTFYDEKLDTEYDICYTPNFYLNTCNWVPCLYDLQSQILWRLYVITPEDFIVYSSCHISCVYSDNNKKAYFYKSKEPMAAKNIGFIAIYEKLFLRMEDPNNKNILYVFNENKKERIEKNLISNNLINTVYAFYEEFFESEVDINSNLSGNSFIIFIPYLLNNSPRKFDKSVKDENYFNFIKFPNLYILPEKLIYNETIPDIMEFQLKNLSKLFITNYIGGLINESKFSDFWLIVGLENWLSDNFLLKCFGQNYMKNRIMKYLRKFKNICNKGKDKRPLYSSLFTHPVELQTDHILYLKSTIVLHLLESHVEKIFVQKALKNIINERLKNGYNISSEKFIKIFKTNCGINLKNFMSLWIFKTGMLDLSVDYNYNKKTNSIDVQINQSPVGKKYFEKNPYFKLPFMNQSTLEFLDKIDKRICVVDFKTRPVRWFDVNFNLLIYQTNGIEIKKETHQIKMDSEKEDLYNNFPLNSKIRKMPIKKREQEFIQELISGTSIGKIYQNEEIEKILTQNSIMWVKADPDITFIRHINIVQQHIIYEYIKLFKEGDVIGMYDSLKNISKNVENFSNSLIILEAFIRSPNYYKVRCYAIKLYIKIILKTKNEEGYAFLLEYLEDCYAEILKNKQLLNRDLYFILKKIIKFLGNYREDNFNEFFVIGRVINSNIQNKIIDKFLTILISNDLNIINGFDDSYIMREILIGCAKLNLQEKTLVLLKKIVKCLRIEKLKRSFNEIIVISSIEAFLILLIKNDFFSYLYSQNNNGGNYSMIRAVVQDLLSEVNHYVDNECENFELKVFLNYFQIYLVFYQSRNFSDFSRKILHILETDLNSMEPTNSYKNENFMAKSLAFYHLIEETNFTFDSLDEKRDMLIKIKTPLHSKLAYLRNDVRVLYEKIFQKVAQTLITSGNYNNNHNPNHKWLNFGGKKFCDEAFLYAFVKEEKKDKGDFTHFIEGGSVYNRMEKKIGFSEIDSVADNQSQFGGQSSQINMLKKYQAKYRDDPYVLMNYHVDTEKKSWVESCFLIHDKIYNHYRSSPFAIPLNEETLGTLYEQYMKIVKYPMDLTTVKTKLENKEYQNFNEFHQDMMLIFSNCRDFNAKGSDVYESANQLEDYYKILISPLKKKNMENIFSEDGPEIKLKLQGQELNLNK